LAIGRVDLKKLFADGVAVLGEATGGLPMLFDFESVWKLATILAIPAAIYERNFVFLCFTSLFVSLSLLG
jgi:hypothetical protein